MNPHTNNRLLNNYRTTQIPNNNTNNQLLNNNQYNNPVQLQQLRELQQFKQIEKENEFDILANKDKIRESVIRPIKIKLTKQDKIDFDNKLADIKDKYMDKTGKNYGSEIQKYWQNRTNEPYKNILKNENHAREFKTKEDLVVHRVTLKDKEGIDDEFKQMNNNLEKHNNELKVIYSTEQRNEHKKKFEYNHVYKYRVQHNTKDHDKLKKDKVKYYKERQKQEETDKQSKDQLFQSLIGNGIFDEEELSGIKLNDEVVDKKKIYLERRQNRGNKN
jgi:hypothetical protein